MSEGLLPLCYPAEYDADITIIQQDLTEPIIATIEEVDTMVVVLED